MSRLTTVVVDFNRLAVELALAHEAGAEQCKKHNDDHKGKALVSGPTVAVADDLGNIRVQLLDEVETLTNPTDDLVDVLVVMQIRSQALSQELLNDSRRQRKSDHGAQRSKEVRASRDNCLVFVSSIGYCRVGQKITSFAELC